MNVTEEQVFEHERFLPIAGWSSRHLLPTERSRYSQSEDGSNSTAQFPQIRLQEGGIPPRTPPVTVAAQALVKLVSLFNGVNNKLGMLS